MAVLLSIDFITLGQRFAVNSFLSWALWQIPQLFLYNSSAFVYKEFKSFVRLSLSINAIISNFLKFSKKTSKKVVFL